MATMSKCKVCDYSEGEDSVNIYDVNNNCNRCGAYVYDQHAKKCEYYVNESLSQFLRRIWKESPEVSA